MSLAAHEEEMFEDDPIEFIRTDLEPSTESDTRRQAATDFTRALMEQFEGEVTSIVKRYIDAYLQVRLFVIRHVAWKAALTSAVHF